MRLALLLLAGCSQTVGGYAIRTVGPREPIYLNGNLVRSRVLCLRKEITVHQGDDHALFHELDHAIHCCVRSEDCEQE